MTCAYLVAASLRRFPLHNPCNVPPELTATDRAHTQGGGSAIPFALGLTTAHHRRPSVSGGCRCGWGWWGGETFNLTNHQVSRVGVCRACLRIQDTTHKTQDTTNNRKQTTYKTKDTTQQHTKYNSIFYGLLHTDVFFLSLSFKTLRKSIIK